MAAPVIVPATRTGGSGSGTDRDAWIRSRHGALAAELAARGVGNAHAVAIPIVAHWAEETGWGRAEYNYNIGNIRNVGQCPRAHLIQGGDDAQPRPYCAFSSLNEGVARTLDLVTAPRYTAAFAHLTATGDGLGWFDRLLRAGWHPWSQSSVNDFVSIQSRVARTVGADPGGSSSVAAWLWAGAAVVIGIAAYIAIDE